MQKILFLGSGAKSFECLKYLNDEISNSKVVGLCPNYYKIKKTNKKIINYAKRNKIKIINFSNISKIKFDLGICLLYDKILSNNILNIPKKGFVNFHLGPLPRYKGSYSVVNAIINARKENNWTFEVTLHYMMKKVDSGPIIDAIKIPITKNDTGYSLYKKSISKVYILFKKNIKSLIECNTMVKAKKQSGKGQFIPRKKINHKIKFGLNINEMYDRIRALTFPGKDRPYIVLNKKKIYLYLN